MNWKGMPSSFALLICFGGMRWAKEAGTAKGESDLPMGMADLTLAWLPSGAGATTAFKQ
jgi:hypothetical protein